jgi:hypothetical protein
VLDPRARREVDRVRARRHRPPRDALLVIAVADAVRSQDRRHHERQVAAGRRDHAAQRVVRLGEGDSSQEQNGDRQRFREHARETRDSAGPYVVRVARGRAPH